MTRRAVLEKMARAIEPETFKLPRINLYKQDYDRAYQKAEAALAAAPLIAITEQS